jgi:D-sedoheptulose 7-phosphate isomerase
MSVQDGQQNELVSESAFSFWHDWTIEIRKQRKCIFLIGNGASASMASHFAADMAKNGRVYTHTFTDLCLLTALANDICYDQVFAEPLRWRMSEGDMLVAISSSGNSPNVLRAVEAARSLGGTAVTLSAMRTDNALRKMGNLNFYVPAQTYGLAETAHAAILHHWMDFVAHSTQTE